MSQDTRFRDADTFSAAIFGKLETETTFANASLADDTNYTTITLDGVFEFNCESVKLVASAVFRFETRRLKERAEVP